MDSPNSSLFIPFALQTSKGKTRFNIDIYLSARAINIPQINQTFSVGNTQWKFIVGPYKADEFLPIQIYCDEFSKSVIWNIDATHKFNFTSDCSESAFKKIEKTWDHSYTLSSRSHRFHLSKEEIDLLIPEGRDEINGENKFTIVVDVEIEIRKNSGMRYKTVFTYDFLTQNDLSTLLLLIEDKRVFVNLDYLAQYSWYFLNLRKEKAESPKIDKQTGLHCLSLEGVHFESFIHLLMIIYPTETRITGDTVEGILKVADYLLFETILIKCESFLISDDPGALNIGVYKKLQWSFDYRMSSLQDHCWEQLISSKSIANLRNDSFYAELTDEVKVFLFDRIMALVNSGK